MHYYLPLYLTDHLPASLVPAQLCQGYEGTSHAMSWHLPAAYTPTTGTQTTLFNYSQHYESGLWCHVG